MQRRTVWRPDDVGSRMRLLFIANPEAYRGSQTDVPQVYRRLARHPEIELFHADTLDIDGGDRIPAVEVPKDFGGEDLDPFSALERREHAPGDFDLAFCRTLKPFPSGYIDALCRISGGLRFVNDPQGIRRQLDPAFTLAAAGSVMPESLVSADPEELADFVLRHGVAVLKTANSCGGRGVYRVEFRDGELVVANLRWGRRRFADIHALRGALETSSDEAVLAMRFLPRVVEGDKRIVVVDGEIYGGYVRRSSAGDWIQNVSAGGQCEASEVTAHEVAMVTATEPYYRAAGIHTLGYDLLRDDDGAWVVSEINAGNIGGFGRLEALGQGDATAHLARWLIEFAARPRRNLLGGR